MSSEDQQPTDEQDELHRSVFVPPETKEDLHNWILFYLGIDFPGEIIDPTSNSSPMDMIWEVYSKLKENNDESFSKVLFYACRDGYKTLGTATLEVVVMTLLRLSTAHMAAIGDQSVKAQQYVKEAFSQEHLRPYLVGDAKRRTEMERPEWAGGGKNYVNVVICTKRGANFEHTPFMVIDEVEVVQDPKAYEEAKMIPSPRMRPDGVKQLPLTVLTSSWKYAFGLVSAEIEGAERSGLHIRHWNLIDVAEKCPPKRHLPKEKKTTIYYSEDTLRAISSAEHALLTQEEAQKYRQDTGYVGCLRNCSLFAMCRGRLAKRKTDSPLLKPIAHVINMFKSVSVETAKAQLMCWKPSSTGLIYTTLSRSLHKRTAAEIAEMLDGKKRHKDFAKSDLIVLMRSLGLSFYMGLDWGFTHNFSIVIFAVDDANRVFVVDCASEAGLELDAAIDLARDRSIPFGGPKGIKMVYPDQALPDHNKTLGRKGGFRIKRFKKDVHGGIEAIRMKLLPASGDPQMYFLGGDEMVDFLFTRLERYKWKLDAAGRPTKDPDKSEDDEADALRYPIQCLFMKGGGVRTADSSREKMDSISQIDQSTGKPKPLHQNWMTVAIQGSLAKRGGSGSGRGRSGNVMWDFGDDDDTI